MKISLIGMSGSGKSFWARRLEAHGFRRFCIDDLIEARLGDELKKFGFVGINDVSRWMGQPFDDRYAANSARYLDLEEAVLYDVLRIVEKEPDAKDIVIDTTGSVVYVKKALLKRLARATVAVYLEIPATARDMLYQMYLDDPKPVIWGDVFTQKSGETGLQALTRCYPELLHTRTKQYEKLGEITLPTAIIQDQDFTVSDFIERIASARG